jgi:hypothetical protein
MFTTVAAFSIFTYSARGEYSSSESTFHCFSLLVVRMFVLFSVSLIFNCVTCTKTVILLRLSDYICTGNDDVLRKHDYSFIHSFIHFSFNERRGSFNFRLSGARYFHKPVLYSINKNHYDWHFGEYRKKFHFQTEKN